ncbi:cytochrome P450 [Kitasatospora sp. SolWspMP-SS2h]|uniref:cytochrome P450 n=1 Tax=Kitasatospora sp. SolWspMP-SS2h TaxID=1305729 RepID=UPI000DBFA013|nr:cytochrome P450 [Kitasatospora sp. SolWspMP-SS2h]RAJ37560.1 cytochrome P450 [Kitasatospora sp. SolWspMP-SS2h]
MTAARRADRTVYLRSHPLLFALLAATRHRPVLRLGRTVLVHHPDAYREVLTRVPLDRTAERTTGGTAARLTGGSLLFDQQGAEHRAARRELTTLLGPAGVAALRPVWERVLDRHLGGLDRPVDLVPAVRELAGATAAALTGSDAPPVRLALAAERAAAATARAHLPALLPRPGGARRARTAADRLSGLLPDPRDAMLAVAAVNTTLAALPRAVAWCARERLWDLARDDAPALAAELLRRTAASPVLPRAAAADATVLGHRVRRGDRLLLVARHAAEAQHDTPAHPHATLAPFGLGPHTCPGAALARAQLATLLSTLAPHRPHALRTSAHPGSALPSYRTCVIGPPRPR